MSKNKMNKKIDKKSILKKMDKMNKKSITWLIASIVIAILVVFISYFTIGNISIDKLIEI